MIHYVFQDVMYHFFYQYFIYPFVDYLIASSLPTLASFLPATTLPHLYSATVKVATHFLDHIQFGWFPSWRVILQLLLSRANRHWNTISPYISPTLAVFVAPTHRFCPGGFRVKKTFSPQKNRNQVCLRIRNQTTIFSVRKRTEAPKQMSTKITPVF